MFHTPSGMGMHRSVHAKPTVNVNDIKNHIKMLAAVDELLPNSGKTLITENVNRYQMYLSLVAKHEDENLIPPLDIAYVWHVHRLAPLIYSKFSRQHFHKILNSVSPFAFQTNNEFTSTSSSSSLSNSATSIIISEAARLRTRLLWKQHTNNAPFFLSSNTTTPVIKLFVGEYDVASAARRQSAFYKKISLPIYSSNEFLTFSIKQYEHFLLLIKESRRRGIPSASVPSVSIDLVWHTHQLLSTTTYVQETSNILEGRPLNHDDNVETSQQWETTKDLWFEMFGKSMIHKHVNHTPMCIENFVTKEFAQNVLQMLPYEGKIEAVKGCLYGAKKTSVIVSDKNYKSFRNHVKNAMFATKVAGGVGYDAIDLDIEPTATAMEIPCRIKLGAAPPHQDRYDGGDEIVDALVAMVYLKGNGILKFENIESGDINEIIVKPGMLVFFQNAQWIHQVVPTDKDTRVMLGPFTFTGEELVRAGDCGGGCGGGDCSSGDTVPRVWGENPDSDRQAIFCWGIMTVCCLCVPACAMLANYEMNTLPAYKRNQAEQEKYRKNREKHMARIKNNNEYNIKKETDEQEQETNQYQQPTVQVQVPAGLHPGDTMIVIVNEVKISIVIPAGFYPGMGIRITPPAPEYKPVQTLLFPTSVLVVPITTEDGWEENLDPKSGYPYWYNSKTGATTWTEPISKKEQDLNDDEAKDYFSSLDTVELHEDDHVIVDQSGKKYPLQRPIPKITELMLKGIETVDDSLIVHRLRVILSTIGSARIQELFYKYDVNRSGGLDRKEFFHLVKRLLLSKPTTEQLYLLQDFMFGKYELTLSTLLIKVFVKGMFDLFFEILQHSCYL